MDANTLETGQVPNDLPDTYIIFITENDTLGCNLPIYHINRTIEENCQQCHDQLHIIYVNSSFQDDTTLGRLMHDLHCSDPHDMHSEILAQRVLELKETQKGVDIMCDKLNELIVEERNEGILIGEAQGEKRGILHTQKETAKNLQHGQSGPDGLCWQEQFQSFPNMELSCQGILKQTFRRTSASGSELRTLYFTS